MQNAPKVTYRKDYQPPTFLIDQVELTFELSESATIVQTRMELRKNDQRTDANQIELDGEDLKLLSLAIDDEPLSEDQYQLNDRELIVPTDRNELVLTTKVEIDPANNTELSGLYLSNGIYCTQCEALGFRRITYFPDRPDVMARYTVHIIGDRQKCPVMLSNGNRMAESELDDGRVRVTWQDPFPKPSYLFALVAGNLMAHSGSFTTCSGREVQLEIWVEPANIDSCEHALASLQKSMAWDEKVYGLEYDLDIYMIVAVNDFNMGAMENKGLNVFNSKYVLGRAETATDDDFLNIERVVAHEYFHNWTGNRVTCRDWFQLTLKEGLTVFRDQRFGEDVTSPDVSRIEEVRILKERQFAEDAGPMAHPIRPESYISMDNFYTVTVYEKGAEVIRMYQTLLGRDGFRKGMDLYFERHDGQAVTCDDFRQAMADANDFDLEQFERWYLQAGTPFLKIIDHWDGDQMRYSLTLTQGYHQPEFKVPGTEDRNPLMMPVQIGLLDRSGVEITDATLQEDSNWQTTKVVCLTEETTTLNFDGLMFRPIPSVLRNFSAPVELEFDRDEEDLAFLMAYDTDPFNRWDAAQKLAMLAIDSLVHQITDGVPMQLHTLYADAFSKVLTNIDINGSLKAFALTLPSEASLVQRYSPAYPDVIHQAREHLRLRLAQQFWPEWMNLYQMHHQPDLPYSLDMDAIHDRRIKNLALAYLSLLDEPDVISLISKQFAQANNMTDQYAAFRVAADLESGLRTKLVEEFYEQWNHDPLVTDKWFQAQALSKRKSTLAEVEQLADHEAFKINNPNRVRSLVGAFMQNSVRFHSEDGGGYRFLADWVIKLNSMNPQLGARLVSGFNNWRQFDTTRQQLICEQLRRVINSPKLSTDVYEIVERALSGADD